MSEYLLYTSRFNRTVEFQESMPAFDRKSSLVISASRWLDYF